MKKELNSYSLISSRFINLLGSGIYNICIPLLLLENTNSVLLTSIFFSIIQLPAIFLLPFLGVWLEKKNLKYCLIISNAFSVLLFLSLYIFFIIYGFNFYFLIIISLLEKINSSIFNVVSSTIVSHLIPKDSIGKLNGMKSIFDNIAYLMAPALGAVLYSYFGLYFAIWLNIISYVISIILSSLLTYLYNITSFNEEPFRKRFSNGFKMIINNKMILTFFILFMVLNFLVSPTEEVFAPGIMKTVYHFKDSLYGWTGSAVSAGIILASLVIGIKNKGNAYMKQCLYVQAGIMIVTGICSVVLLTYSPDMFYIIYLILCFLSGFFSTFVNVPLMSKFQVMVDINYQARFFSILTFFSGLMIPFGTLFAGAMSNVLRTDIAYLLNGALMFIIVFIIFKQIKKQGNL